MPSLQVADVYREHFAFVWRSLRHLGIPEVDVEDAVQDVFLVIHAKLGSFEGRAQLTTWLYGVCLNVARARRRSARVRHELPTDPESLPIDDLPPPPGPEETLERREAERMLDRVLDTLPIEQRAVFTLFELDGRSSEEIAALCDIPLGTVYSRLRLARETFKKTMTRLEARERSAGETR